MKAISLSSVNTEEQQHLLEDELKLKDARVPSCIGCLKLVELQKLGGGRGGTTNDVTTQKKCTYESLIDSLVDYPY